jgi:hypothetical protein
MTSGVTFIVCLALTLWLGGLVGRWVLVPAVALYAVVVVLARMLFCRLKPTESQDSSPPD